MTLLNPIWLFLALPLAATMIAWPQATRLLSCLRLVSVTLILLALCGLALRLPSRAGTVVVVADRSQSMPLGVDAAHKEAIDLIHASMGADDRLAVVSFGETVALEHGPHTDKFPGFVNEVGRDGSALAEALDEALALIPRDAPGKILVFSDGRWTGRDCSAVGVRASARGVAIDYRPAERSAANDVAVLRVDAPHAVNPGEAFMIAAWVQVPTPQEVSFELRRGSETIATGRRTMTSGLNRLTFRDIAGEPGSQSYALQIQGVTADPVPENNRCKVLVGVSGRRPILYVTLSPVSGLPRLLQAGGLEVQTAPPEACSWTLEELSRYSAVVLENVPAERLGNAAMHTLAAWIRATGAGLMMTGGQLAYGPGGYFKSPLDPVMPVSMELRNEHRKLAIAIVVALDRSGSMQASAGGGKRKMDLANLGTAEVLDLLSPMDEFGVIAVDTSPHIIADLAQANNKDKVRGDVLRIDSMGGGIFIAEALKASLKMVAEAKSGTKHVILFADAMDSEEPGNYRELLEQARRANITVSVIGLGTASDKDADLLRDIAKRGNGRVFFTDKPEELPRLFAQDTFVVARSTFLEEPTRIKATSALTGLAGRPFDFSAPIGGYNLCYIRPEATLGVVSVDEYKAPIVAAWQAGIGRVLCYTGEVDGKHTGAIARWNEVGEFFTSLGRWTAGPSEKLSDSMIVTQEVKGSVNRVQLHLDPERPNEGFTGLPRVNVLSASSASAPRTDQTTLQWIGPDTLAVEIPLRGDTTSLATVDIAGQIPVSLPPVCLPYSPEYKPAGGAAGIASLEKLASVTGGKERVELAGIWKDLPKLPRYLPMASWLLLAAIATFLLEILERRTGIISRQAHGAAEVVAVAAERTRRRLKPAPKPRPEMIPVPATTELPATDMPGAIAPTPLPAHSEGREGMLDALRKARQRTRGRLD